MPHYKQKKHKKRLRLKGFDYSRPGHYFVTFVTENRVDYLAVAENGQIILTEIGRVAEKILVEMPQQFSFIEVPSYVIMPDHVHILIRLFRSPVSLKGSAITAKEAGGVTGDKNPMLHNNLSRVIRWYKGRVSYEARKVNRAFSWQSRFHEHIVTTPTMLARVYKYIEKNPERFFEKQGVQT